MSTDHKVSAHWTLKVEEDKTRHFGSSEEAENNTSTYSHILSYIILIQARTFVVLFTKLIKIQLLTFENPSQEPN